MHKDPISADSFIEMEKLTMGMTRKVCAVCALATGRGGRENKGDESRMHEGLWKRIET